MNEKIAAVIVKEPLMPKGGPSGYLYTLNVTQDVLKNFKIFSIQTYNSSKKSLSVGNLLSKLVTRKFYFLYSFFQYKKFFETYIKEIEKYKILHFHKTKDLYFFCKLYPFLCQSKILVLMSHSPVPMHKEVYDNILKQTGNMKLATRLSNWQMEFDVFAFKMANVILFPTSGSVESYEEFFEEKGIDYKGKLEFLLTGTLPFIPRIDRNAFRDKHSIPKDALVFSYVGRRIPVKGFDIFKNAAEALATKYRDIYFIVAGRGMGIEKKENIIDLGWTDDPDSVVNASDFVVVPNRKTYFDLIIIQSLSLDKPIITTLTGGNKFFKGKNLNLLFLKKLNSEALKTIIEDIYNKKIDFSPGRNKQFYEQVFTPKRFVERYNDFYKSLL